MSRNRSWAAFLNPRLGVMLPLGFASGLPLALTSGTLQAWLTVAQVDLRTIGLFTLVGLPYTVKFLWSPVMDRFALPWLGRRRGWMLLTQLMLMVGVAGMAIIGPSPFPLLLAVLAIAVAFISASQDIVFDAYRTDVLHPQERGLGAGFWVTGYRMALVVAGSVALVLADRVGWRETYLLMVGLMLIGVASILWSTEPPTPAEAPRTVSEAVAGPLHEFFSRPSAWGLLGLVILYKLGDAFAAALMSAFLIGGVGFSATDVGLVKGLGLGLTILGALAGGAAMSRLGLVRSLLVYGLLQAVSNLSFVIVAQTGTNYPVLLAAVAFESLSGGMGTAAFLALIMSLCDHRYTATQFALLSSVEAVGRVLVGRPSAELVHVLGWPGFFFVTFLAALPGLWLVWRLRESLARVQSRA